MFRSTMRIEVGRYPNGKLKVIVHHEEDSFFWKSNLTKCLKFEIEKLRLEVLLAIDLWNRKHHRLFERLWNSMKETKEK